ncbi:hypothetical protein [Massilia sp. AB1]|nr:hypothetical protein [Massilia sp. AB1]MBQ5939801.1 hypothetical protein [Massilia sp. AB1]
MSYALEQIVAHRSECAQKPLVFKSNFANQNTSASSGPPPEEAKDE